MLNKKILIIDTIPHIYKLYYGLILKNKININYAINIIIKKIMNSINNINYIIFVFDNHNINYRKIIFKKYKINRKKCSTNFIYLINLFKKKLYLKNINVISIPNIEADDIIGTISKHCERNNFKIFISTYDKDIYQLINDNIKVIDIYNKVIIDDNFIFNKYKIKSKFMIDYISLIGDISDNIKGVFGIGKKISSILINEIGDINLIYKNIKKIYNINKINNSNFVINNLIKYKNNVIKAYNLIKINTDIFTGYKISDFKLK
ncbi:5'-3' exonuclease [Candidatus Nardonella dryophthoridicola]|uniref:DNA polymerase I n=1 Tax=endosymbiont of Rhynchophorus ferrugineus TaxID=1972133 RepID=A0A2Z5T8M7_9GAMM|nr:5'-3' exonuclease H3TH domain-containing protein [Candidatus Nardonella dryophthoridicola]BBA84986.1 DNA polymerase I [endosymbiont of Rhynchophorus ferrugineus]